MPKLLRSKLLLLVSTAFLISPLFSGCGGFSYGPLPEVQITVDYPDADPVAVEDNVCAPILQQLIGIEGDATITCVSRAGRADVYVQAKRRIDPDMFLTLVMNRTNLAERILPKTAGIICVEKVSSPTIPSEAEITEIDSLDIHVNLDKTYQLGLSLEEVSNTLKNQKKLGDNVDSKSADSSQTAANNISQAEELAKKLIFKTAEGKECRLADFATVKTVRKPNIRILRDTPTTGGK